MTENPYSPPAAILTDDHTRSEAVTIREAHVKHETSIKSVGLLYYLAGILMFLAGPALFLMMDPEHLPASGYEDIYMILGAIYLLLGVMSLVTGRGLRKLRGWVRVPVAIVSGLGLLNIPLGTLINGYILYLVFSKKGSTILSQEYQSVIEQTPQIHYKTPLLLWIALILILALPILLFFGMALR